MDKDRHGTIYCTPLTGNTVIELGYMFFVILLVCFPFFVFVFSLGEGIYIHSKLNNYQFEAAQYKCWRLDQKNIGFSQIKFQLISSITK